MTGRKPVKVIVLSVLYAGPAPKQGICDLFGLNKESMGKYLFRWKKEGLVEKIGEGNQTYQLTENGAKYVASLRGNSKKVPFHTF